MDEKVVKKILSSIERNTYKISIVLLVILLVVFIINIIPISQISSTLKQKELLSMPSKIQLFVINCDGCSDVSSVIESVKNKNVDIIKEEMLDPDSNEARVLIEKYGIKNLPTVLIFGEINKTTFNNFELKNDALVLSKVEPPFLDVITNELGGDVSIIEIIDSSCDKCVDITSISGGLEQAGVFISEIKVIEYNSVEGKDLINKFGITKIPTILISDEIDYYESVKQSLARLNLEEKEGFYVLAPLSPPYRDLTSNKIIGLVDLIMLTDSSCTDCYNVEVNKAILQRLGVVVKDEKKYDISSSNGKALVSKYKIEKVPIILLSPEANSYNSLVSAWTGVGSVEEDGWFVMRKPELLGTYKDLRTNQVVKKEQNEA